MSRRRIALLLAALLIFTPATPARAAGLTVMATRELVTWSGAPAGCVYWLSTTGERYRLGCSYTAHYTPLPGELYEGDLVEVRYPTPSGPRTGRAIVSEEE